MLPNESNGILIMKTTQIWNLLKSDLVRSVITGTELYNNVCEDACERYFNRENRTLTGHMEVRPAVKWFKDEVEYFAEIDHTFCVGVRFTNNLKAGEALKVLRAAGIECKMDRDMKTIFSYVSKNDYRLPEFKSTSDFQYGSDFCEYSIDARRLLQQYQVALES